MLMGAKSLGIEQTSRSGSQHKIVSKTFARGGHWVFCLPDLITCL